MFLQETYEVWDLSRTGRYDYIPLHNLLPTRLQTLFEDMKTTPYANLDLTGVAQALTEISSITMFNSLALDELIGATISESVFINGFTPSSNEAPIYVPMLDNPISLHILPTNCYGTTLRWEQEFFENWCEDYDIMMDVYTSYYIPILWYDAPYPGFEQELMRTDGAPGFGRCFPYSESEYNNLESIDRPYSSFTFTWHIGIWDYGTEEYLDLL